jgi:serine/threonine protein phosphatase 1
MNGLGLFRGGRPSPPRGPVARSSTVREARSRLSGTVYAIGDLHGRLDCFETLLGLIRADAEQLPPDEPVPTIILLGDLIDRGPDSAGCIERSIRLGAEDWCQLETIKGNHEQALLQFLDDPGVGPTWVQHGGAATLMSYGVDVQRADPAKGWVSVQTAFAEALPPEHLRFCESMKLWVERDDYIFVHAGVRPGVPIALQSEADLLWIRGEFLRAERPHADKVIVHGHTPRREPDLNRWRIGLDTGAYASGVLTAIRLRGPERMLIQTR